MEEVDKRCPMIRMGVSGWVFLLVPAAYTGSSGPTAVKRLCVCVCVFCGVNFWVHITIACCIMLCRVCVACEGANGGAAEVRGDLEGWEAAAGVNGSRQSWFLLISSQLTVRKHSQGLFTCATDTHTRLMALFPAIPGWAGTRKVKPIWILLKQETLSGSGISWAVCKSASSSRQLTTPAPHHSVFLQAGCPSCRPTNSVKALNAKALKAKVLVPQNNDVSCVAV